MAHNRLHSVLFNKCPRCGEGDFFITKSAYSKDFDKMHKHCPNCGENLVPEPGFYQGALYMSYAFYVVFMLIYFFAFITFFGEYLDYFLYSIVPVLILLTPLFYRLARRSWLALFIKPVDKKSGSLITDVGCNFEGGAFYLFSNMDLLLNSSGVMPTVLRKNLVK